MFHCYFFGLMVRLELSVSLVLKNWLKRFSKHSHKTKEWRSTGSINPNTSSWLALFFHCFNGKSCSNIENVGRHLKSSPTLLNFHDVLLD